ncbi:hypothetical protein A2209_02430 [Candidatus Roizmanbacteria bacterium RIFOXYA1_FULL_41_12]|uniref:SMODS and SLOG-associating 2TM effector domain-containing protein n=1 Tax=Candidatus Roizmanbacteria bacterium RIFOXYA1_FULL_41_12 TaxID=1802082 RepID=A0A1F7K9L0_9BACT|nr:MAG: hypothetical protein A2209_02430 [Candidatus Roizmanbacteria bacterium RIFOXYA1_FULL_41_12]OGK67747.1 MAG: hypothetical protein A2262_01695 [Candidatus Roizmanbacteria bacterium RIFOXYA2_FULL_41_8]
MLAHKQRVEKLLQSDSPKTQWQRELDFFNLKFVHFQQERLIHLLVTLTVGLACLLSCLTTLFYPLAPLYMLDAILMALFWAYLNYYRRLENTAQSWYQTLDDLQKKI